MPSFQALQALESIDTLLAISGPEDFRVNRGTRVGGELAGVNSVAWWLSFVI